LIGFTFAPLFVAHSRAATRTDDFSIRIMSHNLFGHQNAKALADVIRLEQPDIVLLQEYNAAITPTLLYELAGLYPGNQVYVDVVHSQATLSRYPITHTDVAWDKGRVQKIVVETPAGSMAVWNVHFYPPFMYPPQVHDRQVDALVVDIAAIDRPLIVAGDFNVTDQSATYRLINHYLHNAHRSAGWGFGFTFPARPHTKGLPLITGPIYRIDHVFYNHHFVAYHARTLTTSAGSDHLPIVAELSLAE
jgi:vancomycin resistance protein VanJ